MKMLLDFVFADILIFGLYLLMFLLSPFLLSFASQFLQRFITKRNKSRSLLKYKKIRSAMFFSHRLKMLLDFVFADMSIWCM